MLCPNCKKELGEIAELSHYGSPIKLNQCQNCGGIWFDNLDLFGLEESEAKELEDIRVKNPKEDRDNSGGKDCPLCNVPLVRLQDPVIPKDINIETCPKCQGMWMDHGETLKYKKFQEKKIEERALEEEQKNMPPKETEADKEFNRALLKEDPNLFFEINGSGDSKEGDKDVGNNTLGGLFKKIIAAGLSLYFIISEAYYLIKLPAGTLFDMEMQHPLLFSITILKYVLIFLALPILYFFKTLSHFGIPYRLREYDEPQDSKAGFFEANLFYWAIYITIFVLGTIRVVGYFFVSILK
jgi:uncharacterized protein